MISGEEEQVIGSKGGQQLRHPRVEALQVAGVTPYVIPVAVERVEVDEVGEDEPRGPGGKSGDGAIHAVVVGNRMYRLGNAASSKDVLDLPNRLIIPNDNKLFAQAHTETEVTHFATSDIECMKVYSLLSDNTGVDFEVMNIREPYLSVLGVLPFNES